MAFEKKVTVVWATGSNAVDWSDDQRISASWEEGPDDQGFEIWRFVGGVKGAKQFYVEYKVAGET